MKWQQLVSSEAPALKQHETPKMTERRREKDVLIQVMIKLINGSEYILQEYSVNQMNKPAPMTPTFPN